MRCIYNAWNAVCDDGVLRMMRLCGCDEKYVNGTAADYECFAEWLRLLPLCAGSNTARAFVRRMGGMMRREVSFDSICGAEPRELWREIHTDICGGGCQTIVRDEKRYLSEKLKIEKYVSKNINIYESDLTLDIEYASRHSSLEVACKSAVEYLKSLENRRNICLSLSLAQDGFIRPEPYGSELEFGKMKNGEKYNSNAVLCQMLYFIILNFRDELLYIHISPNGNFEYAVRLFEYLRGRGISAKFYLHTDTDCNVAALNDACDACCGGGTYGYPVIKSGKRATADFLTELAQDYPIGCVYVSK